MRNRLTGPPLFLFLILALLALAGVTHSADYDLDAVWISRLPALPYPRKPKDPRRNGWPAVGQAVKWQAHVRNWGKSDAHHVSYKFLLDGAPVASGFLEVRGHGGSAIATYSWPWEFKRHDLTFVLDSENVFKEIEEANNRLTVKTDAISVGFYVEKSVYEYFQANQELLKAGSNSWEDWAQRQISTLNSMYASAISPEAPAGVLDRWRIDEIKVVHDGSLPLQGGSGPGRPFRDPNTKDHIPDIIWGFPATVLDGVTYRNVTSKTPRNAFYIEGSLIHELNHVRYLIDVYFFMVKNDGQTEIVQIEQDGRPVAGTSLMPVKNGIVYSTIETGLMNQTYTYIDRYSSIALNLIAGYRARGLFGNTIYNPQLGIFLKDIPKAQRIRFVDVEGNPISGARVELFKADRGPLISGGPFGMQYQILYRNSPDFDQTTDANGEVTFRGDPIRKPGESAFLTGVSILRITKASDVSFAYFEFTAAQRAYWRGERKIATYEFVIGGDPCQKSAEHLKATRGQNDEVRFEWSHPPGAYGYVVWASQDGKSFQPLGNSYQTNFTASETGRLKKWYVESDFDQCLRSNSKTAPIH